VATVVAVAWSGQVLDTRVVETGLLDQLQSVNTLMRGNVAISLACGDTLVKVRTFLVDNCLRKRLRGAKRGALSQTTFDVGSNRLSEQGTTRRSVVKAWLYRRLPFVRCFDFWKGARLAPPAAPRAFPALKALTTGGNSRASMPGRAQTGQVRRRHPETKPPMMRDLGARRCGHSFDT